MSRSRNIKPGFFTNGDLLECQPLARLLFAGLWCEADRRGILEDRPKTIKVKILPGDDCDVDALLTELADHGFIKRYQADGIRCIYLPSFEKHQNPHVREQASTLPALNEHHESPVLAPDEHDASPADSLLLIPDSPILNPESENTPLPPEGEPVRRTKRSDLAGFDEFYRVYPRHIAKADAERTWMKMRPDERQAAIDAIRRQLLWPQFTDAPPDKIPYPATWLNKRRWEDEPPQIVTANGRSSPPTNLSTVFDRLRRERGEAPRDDPDVIEAGYQVGARA